MHGGENMKQFFALLLAQQICIALINASRGDGPQSILGQSVDEAIYRPCAQIELRLREKRKFFYNGVGDVKIDFEINRDFRFTRASLKKWREEKNLSITMTADQILEVCIQEVQTWW